MTKVKKLLFSLIFALSVCTMPVMASEGADRAVEAEGSSNEEAWSTGSAIEDILDNERYSGAIESITWITTRVDTLFIMVITFTAFAIISAAILKNVFAGLYAVFPKFFDKVDEAHTRVEAWGITGIKNFFGGGYQNTSAGAVRDTLLALIPNIKALTDFDDGTVEPKHYFMQSIPKMIAAIIIGVFIYNGYYRDTAMLVGSVGAETFERVFWGIDPAAILDRLTQTTGMPAFATDNATDMKGKLINDVTKKMYRAVLSKYTDVREATAKAVLGASIEEWAISAVEEYCGNYVTEATGKVYKYAVSSIKLSLVNNESSAGIAESNDGDKATVTLVKNVREFTFDSTKESGVVYYAYVYINFSRDADAEGSGSSSSYSAGTVQGALNQSYNNGDMTSVNKAVLCNASYTQTQYGSGTGTIHAPSGYEFYYTGSGANNRACGGLTITLPRDRGYYSTLSFTGSPDSSMEQISFGDIKQMLYIVDKNTNTKYPFAITIVR